MARQYAGLSGKTISVDNANKLRQIFKRIPDSAMDALRRKKIPFLSGLALSRMVQKGMPVKEDKEEPKLEPGKDGKVGPAGKIALAKEKDTDALEAQLVTAKGQIELLKTKLENEKNKAVKPEPNKETGEVPLTVGVAHKYLKDKQEKEKEEKKDVKEAFAVQITKKDGGKLIHGKYKDKAAADKFVKWYKTGDNKDTKSIEVVKEMAKDDAYAIGMAQAKKSMNDEKPLEKKTITKGHEIAKKILAKEARYRVSGQMTYRGISGNDGFEMVINANSEQDAEDKAYKELDKARSKRKIGPGGGGSIEDVDIEGVEKTNDRLDPPSHFRVSHYDPSMKEGKAPFRLSYDDRYGKHAGFEDAKTLADLQNKAANLRKRGFVINKMGRNTSPVKEENLKEADPITYGPDKVAKAMAIAVKSDGQYSKAVREIEKIGKDLSKVSTIARALKTANEDLDAQPQDKDVKKVKGTQPKKYYKKLDKDTKKKRADFFKKKSGSYKKSDDNDDYKAAPGDKKAKTKTSIHTKKFKQMYGEGLLDLEEKIKGIENKAKKTGMPYGILKKVYDRGMAAWKGGHRPGATQQQWAFARVNSFVTKSSGTWGGADKDLAKKVRGSK